MGLHDDLVGWFSFSNQHRRHARARAQLLVGRSRTYKHFDWGLERRVCNPNFFDRYFGFTIPEYDLSSSELWQLIDGAGDYAATIARFRALRDRGLIDVALDRLDDLEQKVPIAIAGAFVPAIFAIGDEINEDAGFMSMGANTHAWRIV